MSETLIPTMRLRFVHRGTRIRNVFTGETVGPALILQQAFTVAETHATVWRDVPIEKEES